MDKKPKEPSYITIIHLNGEYETYEQPELSLKQAQELVGGLVQVVPTFIKFEGKPCAALCDEEGKMKGKQQNSRATIEWTKSAKSIGMDFLVGDVVIVTGPAWRKWR